jgi:hypothetical protein
MTMCSGVCIGLAESRRVESEQNHHEKCLIRSLFHLAVDVSVFIGLMCVCSLNGPSTGRWICTASLSVGRGSNNFLIAVLQVGY